MEWGYNIFYGLLIGSGVVAWATFLVLFILLMQGLIRL